MAEVFCPAGRRRVVQQEDQFGPAAAAEADLVAVHEDVLGDRLVVDERPAAGAAIAEQAAAGAVVFDLGVFARDVAADHAQIALAAAADAKEGLVDRHDTPTRRVADLKSWRDGHVMSACLQHADLDSMPVKS